jgi:hypothetical protein
LIYFISKCFRATGANAFGVFSRMFRIGIRLCLVALATIHFLPSAEQIQSCPININFSGDNLTHWEAYTGNNQGGNGPGAIKVTYDSTQLAPAGTINAITFP